MHSTEKLLVCLWFPFPHSLPIVGGNHFVRRQKFSPNSHNRACLQASLPSAHKVQDFIHSISEFIEVVHQHIMPTIASHNLELYFADCPSHTNRNDDDVLIFLKEKGQSNQAIINCFFTKMMAQVAYEAGRDAFRVEKKYLKDKFPPKK